MSRSHSGNISGCFLRLAGMLMSRRGLRDRLCPCSFNFFGGDTRLKRREQRLRSSASLQFCAPVAAPGSPFEAPASLGWTQGDLGWIQGGLGAWMCVGFPPAARPRAQSVLVVRVWCRGWAAKRFPGLQALGCSFPSPAKCWQPSRLRGQAKKRRGGIGLRRLLHKKSRAGAGLRRFQRKSYSCTSSLPTKARRWSSP